MPDGANLILLAIAVLLAKHCVADYFLQFPYQFMNKGRYLHPGGLLHAAIHVAMTPPVMLVIAPESAVSAALLLGAEFLIHYHMDWTKEKVGRALALTPLNSGYWRMMGIDQLVHGLTYVGIVWWLLTPGIADLVLDLVK